MRSEFFVAGGTLHFKSPSYVERAADRELYEALASNEYCYVLDSRQKGKSSLISRADQRLSATGVETVRLDLQRYGSNVTAEQWFAGMLNDVGEDLDLGGELFEYWGSHQRFGPLKRFFGALAEVVLPLQTKAIVIFIDEIDFVLSLPFSADEFFAGVRELYNRRSDEPIFRRLTFCLAGVATPSSLIRDVRITPFNIGRRVELTDFTLEELLPFATHLGPRGAVLIRRVHHWTGGHPYLTQRLCFEVAGDASIRTGRDVDHVVSRLFCSAESRRDEPNLVDVSRRMLESHVTGFPPDEVRTRLLDLYREVLDRTRVVQDDDTDPFAETVKLSGLTRTVGGRLLVRNRLYAMAFDRAWIASNLPDSERRRQEAAFRRGMWRAAGAFCGVILLTLIPLVIAFSALGDSASNRRLAQLKASFADEEARLAGSVLHAERMIEIRSLWNRNGAGVASIKALLNDDPAGYRNSFEWRYYNRLCNLALYTYSPPEESRLTCLAVAGPNAIFTGESNGTVRSIRVDGTPTNTARVSPEPIDRLACSPADANVVVADASGTIQVWNTNGGEVRELLPHHVGRLAALARSPTDGEYFAIGIDGSYLKSSLNSPAAVSTGRLPDDRVKCAALSPAAHLGAYSGTGSEICLFDLDGPTVKRRYRLPGKEMAARLAFTPDGQSLAISEQENRVCLLNTQTGEPRWSVPTQNAYAAVSFSADGQRLVVGGNDNSLEVLRSKDGLLLFNVKGHDNPVIQVSFVGETRLASMSRDEFKLWEGRYGVETHIFAPARKEDLTAIHMSPDFLTYQTGHANGDIEFWQPFVAQPIDQISGSRISGATSPVSAITSTNDGTTLAFGLANGSVSLCQGQGMRRATAILRLEKRVTSLAFSQDGRYLAAGDAAGNVAVWDVNAKTPLATRAFGASVSGLAFDPTSAEHLAVASERLSLVSPLTLSEDPTWKPNDRISPTCVAFSPDGVFLAAADANGDSVKVFECPSGQLRKEFHGHDKRVRSCAFSPDGLRLATTDNDGITLVLDMETEGEVIPVLEFTYPGSVNVTTTFNQAGTRLFSGSITGWSQFWNAE